MREERNSRGVRLQQAAFRIPPFDKSIKQGTQTGAKRKSARSPKAAGRHPVTATHIISVVNANLPHERQRLDLYLLINDQSGEVRARGDRVA